MNHRKHYIYINQECRSVSGNNLLVKNRLFVTSYMKLYILRLTLEDYGKHLTTFRMHMHQIK